ncbi:hypothetical protein F5Y13DRAFT_163069 [Hypoxylon sp. FL1857]|nr:hypothetical protein F5Y13DRAFT_163069 [Hypoxylon sp. FL1857]
MPSSNLTTLPLEILIQIASYLNTPDYQAIRLSCRGIEASLFRAFAQQYFRKIQFMRTEYSLQALVDISKSRFSSYLQHVVITTQLLSPRVAPNARWRPGNIESDAGEERFNRMCDDQAVLLNTGYDQHMLVEAFSNLKLEAVGIHGQPSHHMYHGPASYGISHIKRETLVNLRFDTAYAGELGRRTTYASCLQNVLLALGKSGSTPKRFEIDMYNSRVGDDAFNIPPFMEKVVSPVLTNLEAVDLRFHPCSESTSRLIAPRGQAPHKIETYYLRTLFSQLTQIKSLRIDSLRQSETFFEWLAAPVSNEGYDGPPGLEPPRSLTLPKLHELELNQVELRFNDLLTVIEKFSATLRKLTVSKTLLHLISSTPVVTPAPSVWPGLLARLARVGRCLTEISLDDVDVGSGYELSTIGFKDGGYSFSYAGPNMKKVLGDLVGSVRLVGEPSESEESDVEEDWGDDSSQGDVLGGFDFDEFMEMEEYDDLLDEIDQDLNEDLMIEAIFGLGQ